MKATVRVKKIAMVNPKKEDSPALVTIQIANGDEARELLSLLGMGDDVAITLERAS